LLNEIQELVTEKRIDLKFELKTLERTREKLRREAQHQKQVVEEEDQENNTSQNLSDSEDHIFREDNPLVGPIIKDTEDELLKQRRTQLEKLRADEALQNVCMYVLEGFHDPCS